ncbi:MAG: hypothetical protein Q7S76_01405, partial [bacterium]|nr:hypothetical protein [bacterium]
MGTVYKKLALIFLLIGTSVLLLYKLDLYPRGFHIDEVRVGNTAWSLIKTGKDFYGNPFPIYFDTAGDYRPMGLMYLTAPFVATLGLSEFSVRLPSALFGIASVFLFYFLVT